MLKKDRFLNLLVCAVFGFLGGIVSSAGLISVKSADQDNKALKVNKLEIVDTEGRVTAKLASYGQYGARLIFLGEKGLSDSPGETEHRLSLGWIPYAEQGRTVVGFRPGIEIHKDGKTVWSAH